MRARDVRELSDQELDSKEEELTETVFRFRLRRGTGQLESSAALRSARRDLARVKTVKNERTKTRGDQA
jgi:large subunit ribosomal protein L29